MGHPCGFLASRRRMQCVSTPPTKNLGSRRSLLHPDEKSGYTATTVCPLGLPPESARLVTLKIDQIPIVHFENL